MKKLLLLICSLLILIALSLSSCKPKQNCPAYPPYSKVMNSHTAKSL